MNYEYGIIILNYIGWEETIECVYSFLRQSAKYSVHIVIVDNASPNDSFSKLKAEFLNEQRVDVIVLNDNLGFARGNNEGFYYLNDHYSCDFYIFSNSDILITDDVFSWIEREYETSHFFILGPDIFAIKMQMHQNPISKYTENPVIIKAKILKKRIEIAFDKLCLLFGIQYDIHDSKLKQKKDVDQTKRFENVTVHGSFIVAYKNFFDYYKELFDSRTFLYMEEHILFQRCKKYSLKTVVSYAFQVIHLQAASTDKITKSIYKRRIARMKNEICSVKVYEKVLKELK